MTVTLRDPARIGALTLRNRLYRAPVLEGAGTSRDPAGTYARAFQPNARAGIGLIVQGNTVVTPEGRTSPGMTSLADRAQALDLRRVTDVVHAEGGAIVAQLGHGGLFALESWHAQAKRSRARAPLAPSLPPWWLRAVHGGVHVPTTDEVGALVARFGVVAAWLRDAGYDGVQLAASNAKLLHQFLSRTYNRRADRYGGDLAGRARILVEIREAVAREAGSDFPVLLKFCAVEVGRPGGGITLDDGVAIARIAEQAGFDAVTPAATSALPDTALCKGGDAGEAFENPRYRERLTEAAGSSVGWWGLRASMWAGARRHPFAPVWNRPVFAAVKAAVKIPVFAVGGIRRPEEAAAILAAGEADLIGLGRPLYAEPELPRAFLAGDGMAWCESCNRCVVPQMLGMPGVCYNPALKGKPRGHRASAPAA